MNPDREYKRATDVVTCMAPGAEVVPCAKDHPKPAVSYANQCSSLCVAVSVPALVSVPCGLLSVPVPLHHVDVAHGQAGNSARKENTKYFSIRYPYRALQLLMALCPARLTL